MKSRDLEVGVRRIVSVAIGLLLVATMACGPTPAPDNVEEPPEPVTMPAPADEDADPPKKADVKIKIKKQGDVHSLLVGPRGVGACGTPGDDCDDYVTFEWIGNKRDYETVTIQATGENADCLSPSTIVLTDTKDPQTATVNTEGCLGKQAWMYEVTAEDTDGDNPTLTLDPGVIIDN
jgi:hypothetical protein